MHKYNKIRGILRAKQGSQIPKFWPGGQFNAGTEIPTELPDSMMNDGNKNYLDESTLATSTPFAWSSRNGELSRAAVNSMKDFKIPASKIPPFSKTPLSFGRKVKIAGKIAGKELGNFANNNLDLIIGGVDYLSNSLFGGTKNSSEYDTIIGGAKTLRNNLKGPAKWWATAGIAAVEGLNKIGASTIDNTYINQDVANKAGGSYAGTMALGEKAMANNGVEFGLFNRGGYRSAKRTRDKFLALQGIATGVVNEAANLQAMINDLNYLYYDTNINGIATDPLTYRALSTKLGGTLTQKIDLVKSRKFNQVINVDTKLVEEFKEGGKLTNTEWEPVIELFEEWEPEIILEVEEFQKGGKTRTLEELIEYAKKENPRFIQRLSEDPRGIDFVDEEGKNAQGSHLLGYELDEEGNAIVFPSIQEMEDGNLKYLSLWDAFDRAIEKKNFLKMTPEEAKLFTESGEDELGNLFGYKKGWPEFFKKFKKGGTLGEDLETPEIEETNQKNLIPEGALHKNKHHMEHTEGLTLKGIPVIDNDGEQLAEIELDEIIFTLEVTKKLEELYKEGTDEAAIEAGKLLVKEILFNTDDRTGLISKCEKGGKICQ